MLEKIFLNGESQIEIFDAIGVCNERPLHFHDCLEMNLVTDGHGINFVEDKKYEMSRGELYVMNNYEHHISMSDGTLKMKVLIFYPEFVLQNTAENYSYLVPFYGKNEKFKNKITLDDEAYSFVMAGFEFIEAECKNKAAGWKLAVKAKLLEILAYIYRYAECEKNAGSAVSQQTAYERIRKSIEYIQQHYTEEISMEYLAELSCMSRTYFSRYFKETTGMTVTAFIETLRINRAQCAMGVTGKTIAEICFECGYQNISSFNVAFRKNCGMTPSDYRKQLNKKT